MGKQKLLDYVTVTITNIAMISIKSLKVKFNSNSSICSRIVFESLKQRWARFKN